MEPAINELARTRMSANGRRLVLRELKAIRTVLPSDERIIEMFAANLDGVGKGLLLVTAERIVFFKTGLMPGLTDRLIEMPLSDVTRVDFSKGAVKGVLTVQGTANRIQAKDVDHADNITNAARYIREQSQLGTNAP